MRFTAKKLKTALLFPIALVFSLFIPARQMAQASAASWRPAAAAQYLDERMKLWFEKGKKLRTGQEKTTCVSCHTVIPYMLARPALRRAMNVKTPTAQETRVMDEVTRRVAAPDTHQPFYDHTESKKIESRGVEAVLNALVLASTDAAQASRQRSPALRQAFARLWETQRPDGAWDWLDFGLEPFETTESAYFGATLAALAAGMAPADARERAAMEKLRGYLTANYAKQGLFYRTWLLLAASRWPALLSKAQRDTLRAELQRQQRADGGWSLHSLSQWHWSKTAEPYRPPGTLDETLQAQSDGFATGLVVYALRQTGSSAKQPMIAKGLAWLRQQQPTQPDQTAWRAYSLNFDREHGGDKGEPWRRMFMSDLATAFAALALLNPN